MSWLQMTLVGLLSALLVQAIDTLINPPQRFASVDVIAVVQEHIDAMAMARTSGGAVAPESVSVAVDQAVTSIALDYNVTLLVRQAVVGGDMPDVTEELRRRLKQP